MSRFAGIIVDISHEKVDRTFDYKIPEGLYDVVKPGTQVRIPFGKSNRLINGFVVSISDRTSFDESRIKYIDSVIKGAVTLEGTMIELAAFIKENYGSTMNRALKTVLPAKMASAPIVSKYVCFAAGYDRVTEAIEKYGKDRRTVAKLRLLTELRKERLLPYEIIREKLNISVQTIKSLEKEGIIRVEVKENLRDAFKLKSEAGYCITLNENQRYTADDIFGRFKRGDLRPSLIRGITGSGKTEVYIELIDKMVKEGKQAIVLIPEIALTYQTVMRFYKKFGDRISVINSKLTPAQKYDQLEKAKRGDVDIIIGPRSALFAPFRNLGIIVIDEEHEPTYKNENIPRYHSREVAIKRAEMAGGIVVLGSATPSVESYDKALSGEYKLYELEKRATGAGLPQVEIVDLRLELASGNRSMISARLDELIRGRLERNEQIILFLNRRGYSSFVSCRSCGEAVKCPHCDVALKYHNNGKLICHYCGYETDMVKICPSCGSKYIGKYGTGTQKIEEELKKLYPNAGILRMDYDTTHTKDGHEKILSAFSNHEADILVGTQMIVKGHDFANVTLVGILLADMSLYSGDYLAGERTFEILTQAAGRAGRGDKPGQVVIQTYSPDNYAVRLGALQNYKDFFEMEMDYRKLLGYPPVMNMLGIWFSSEDPDFLNTEAQKYAGLIDRNRSPEVVKIGPSEAPIAKIQDKYRKVIYIKAREYTDLTRIKDIVEEYSEANPDNRLTIVFDFSMMGSRAR